MLNIRSMLIDILSGECSDKPESLIPDLELAVSEAKDALGRMNSLKEELSLLEEELSYEPKAALDGGDDGLIFYRALIGEYGKYLRKGGAMLLEIGCDQAKAIFELSHLAGYRCEIYKDYGGNDRVAYITKP